MDTKNGNILKQYNSTAEIFSTLKQEDSMLINPYSHMLDSYNTGRENVMGVSLLPHPSHPMYNNIVPDMQHVSFQPPTHFMLQGEVTENSLPLQQDYVIQELQPQSSVTPVKVKRKPESSSPAIKSKPRGKSKERPFECEICFRRFNQKQTLKQHILTHTGQRPFECDVCFKTFTQQGALQRHVVIHTGEKPFQCTFCELNFRQKINLLRHMKLHTGAPKEFQCRVCKREFSRKGALLRHEPIHDAERPRLRCSCCNKEFLNKESLVRHEKNQELREKGIKCPKSKLRRSGKIEKIIIKCKHCGRTLRRSKSVQSITSDEMATSCLLCASSQFSIQAKSLGIHREVEIFQCDICRATLHTVTSYEKHKRLHSSDRKFECAICHLRFKEKRFIRSHMITHMHACEHQCHMCGLNFKYASQLKAHYVLHAEELKDDLANYVRVFNCSICGRCFYARNHIIRHLKTHEKEAAHMKKEIELEARIENAISFDHNVDSISDDNGFDDESDNEEKSESNHPGADMSEPSEEWKKTHPFFCYICKRSYTKKRSLNRHFQVAHTNYEKLPCEICSKTFQTKNSLKAHYVVHRPHRFQCDRCEKTFNRKDALASHKLIHSENKSFLCHYCSKSFFQKQSLHTHLMQHKGKRSYECGVCGKSFYEKSTLNRHYLSHSGERKYSCHICNMAFIQKNHLDKHFLRHDEIEKKVTFECGDCKKCFYRKDHYLRHRQSHENNRTIYPCSLCNGMFTDKYSLARHVKHKKCAKKEGARGRKKKRKESREEGSECDKDLTGEDECEEET